MTVHIVKAGESLSQIAQHYGIKYWANLYLSAENDPLFSKRRSPDMLLPGDKIVIPSKASIATLESRPEVKHTLPKLFTQARMDLCWEASAEMVFCWKFPTPNAEEDFKTKLGTDYHTPVVTLASARTILPKLGMTTWNIHSVNELHQTVASGPLWVAEINGSAHAQVLTGYNLKTLEWYLLDPLGQGMTITFGEDGGVSGGATGTTAVLHARKIDSLRLDNTVYGYR
jgi:Papain-like cysteine protease AvrRpt2/LysM domain